MPWYDVVGGHRGAVDPDGLHWYGSNCRCACRPPRHVVHSPAATHGHLPRAPRAGSPRERRHHMSSPRYAAQYSAAHGRLPRAPRAGSPRGWRHHSPPKFSVRHGNVLGSMVALGVQYEIVIVRSTHTSSDSMHPTSLSTPQPCPSHGWVIALAHRRRRAPPWLASHVSTPLSPTSCTGTCTHMHVLGITAVGNIDHLLP